MEIKFGTDGWRGVIAREFTFANVSLVAQATMDYLKREGLADKGLVVGYDRRFLSREFAERVAEVASRERHPGLAGKRLYAYPRGFLGGA